MGLTSRSTGLGALREAFSVAVDSQDDLIIALAGNPNTGKSTIFNGLTGLRQHTGNWPGKTVSCAQGKYVYRDRQFVLVDLPGTYSILSNSPEEEVARDFLCFSRPHMTVVVADATCLERNLNLVLQIMETGQPVIVCVNLLDEAKRKQISVDLDRLSLVLGVPVVGTNARDGVGLCQLRELIYQVALRELVTKPLLVTYDQVIEQAVAEMQPQLVTALGRQTNPRWVALRLLDGDAALIGALQSGFAEQTSESAAWFEQLHVPPHDPERVRELIVDRLVTVAEQVAQVAVQSTDEATRRTDRLLDNIVTSRRFGIPLMLLLLGLVFWLTMQGANLPSELLSDLFLSLETRLSGLITSWGWPQWLHGLLIAGMYRTLTWVVAVMLPPMAIFFPLFTLLEDLGYLPRVAFNLDGFFRKARAHGKQALTMCMGFGCNAAGVVACRIIDSPRERLLAIITNNFVPCNGRFPLLITLSGLFIAGAAGAGRSVIATLVVLGMVVLAILITLLVCRLLSHTLLGGLPSGFTLELPPYRRPKIGRLLLRSLLDRTLFVLGRAAAVAAPAGGMIWLMANICPGGISLLDRGASLLQPFAYWLGLDGYILLAFILGLPANEIVIPIIVMSYLSGGAITELGSLHDLQLLLQANGWTWLTAISVMLFSLNHWPCATTLLTIRSETQSSKWTWAAMLIPTAVGTTLCFLVASTARLLGLA